MYPAVVIRSHSSQHLSSLQAGPGGTSRLDLHAELRIANELKII